MVSCQLLRSPNSGSVDPRGEIDLRTLGGSWRGCKYVCLDRPLGQEVYAGSDHETNEMSSGDMDCLLLGLVIGASKVRNCTATSTPFHRDTARVEGTMPM